jgi:hypothetical protein
LRYVERRLGGAWAAVRAARTARLLPLLPSRGRKFISVAWPEKPPRGESAAYAEIVTIHAQSHQDSRVRRSYHVRHENAQYH